MNINDLETCEIVESGNQIIGGAATYVKGKANAKRGNADAKVLAIGIGKNNSTKTKTNARASEYSAFGSYTGSAVSQTGSKYSASYDSGSDYDY